MAETPTPTPNSAPAPDSAPAAQTPMADSLYGKPEGEAKPEAGAPAPEGDKAPEGEAKPEAEAKPDEAKPDGEAKPLVAADLKLPEGFEASEALANFTTFANEAGLDKEKAQSLLDLHLSELAKAETAHPKAWTDTVASWKEAIEKDPELGGEKTKDVQTVLGRALDEYGSAEAREAFDATGAGWNPHIVKFVHKMAKALTEGGPIAGAPKAPQRTATPAQRLYGETAN